MNEAEGVVHAHHGAGQPLLVISHPASQLLHLLGRSFRPLPPVAAAALLRPAPNSMHVPSVLVSMRKLDPAHLTAIFRLQQMPTYTLAL